MAGELRAYKGGIAQFYHAVAPVRITKPVVQLYRKCQASQMLANVSTWTASHLSIRCIPRHWHESISGHCSKKVGRGPRILSRADQVIVVHSGVLRGALLSA